MQFLKRIREDRKMSQYEMATFLGLRPQTYFYYEKKAKGINLDTLDSVREKLGISWEELGKLIHQEVTEDRKKAKK